MSRRAQIRPPERMPKLEYKVHLCRGNRTRCGKQLNANIKTTYIGEELTCKTCQAWYGRSQIKCYMQRRGRKA